MAGGGKAWGGRLLLALLVPVVLLTLVEGGLRLAGVGTSTRFLSPGTDDGQPVWLENPFFTYQVFTPPLARAPAPVVVDRDKPEGVLRVVVLGESAAQGDPMPVFGPPRTLEKLLALRYPDQTIEVINAAVTAINSHVIRRIADDLDRLDPDVVILYIGNNEVIGPYGPGTTFTRFSDSDLLLRLVRGFRGTRLSQALHLGLALSAERGSRETFGGVAMFLENPVPADDPRVDVMLRRYRRNLEVIADKALRTGAEVLVSSVAVNRTDCPPSISVHRSDLSTEELDAWQATLDRAIEAMEEAAWEDALGLLDEAADIDRAHAELQFCRGHCLAQLGRAEDAREAFDLALRNDAFRYRTDDRMNAIVLDLADRMGLPEVDASAAFARLPDVSDRDLFVDHVHFSPRGTYELARLWANALVPLLDLPPDTPEPTFEACLDALQFTARSEAELLRQLIRRHQRPPFTLHLDQEERLADYHQRLREALDALRAADAGAADARYREAMARFPRDPYLPDQFATDLINQNRFRDAVELLQPRIGQRPDHRAHRTHLALSLTMLGQPQAAVDALTGWSDRQGFFAAADSASLVQTLVRNGALDPALATVSALHDRVHPLDYAWRIEGDVRALRFYRDRLDEARGLVRAGHTDAADELLSRLVELRDDVPDTHFWRGVLRGRAGDPGGGLAHVRQATRLWGYARANYHLGLWEARQGRDGEARRYLHEAVRRAGDDLALLNSLAWVLAVHPEETVRDPRLAREMVERALDAAGEPDPRLLDTAAAVAAANGAFNRALELSAQARDLALARAMNDLVLEIDERRALYREGRAAGWGVCNAPLNMF